MKIFELFLKDLIEGRRQGFFPTLILLLLLPLSWIYSLVVFVRNQLYDKGWMRCYIPPVQLVISVGNIVAGGTGKTPVILWLMGMFYDKYTIAVLTRGYRSKAEKLEIPLILCEEAGPSLPASYCGDEPAMLAKRFPKAMIIVGKNRKKGCKIAAKASAQVIFLDDAFQHRRLGRDFDLVLVDGRNLFGGGYFLPRGYLRENPTGLSRASLILINRIENKEEFENAKKELMLYTKSPIVGIKSHVTTIKTLEGKDIAGLQQMRVGMFCSIAHPCYFKETVTDLGATIVADFCLPDHDLISEDKLRAFAAACLELNANWLVCTEKDRVKLRDDLLLPLPIAWIGIDLEILEGKEEMDHFIRMAKAKIY